MCQELFWAFGGISCIIDEDLKSREVCVWGEGGLLQSTPESWQKLILKKPGIHLMVLLCPAKRGLPLTTLPQLTQVTGLPHVCFFFLDVHGRDRVGFWSRSLGRVLMYT